MQRPEVFIGWDPAWADKVPGAVAVAVGAAGARRLVTLQRARASEAVACVRRVCDGASASVLAIDQPLEVHNASGARPVDRALASMMARGRSGVQPANTTMRLFAPSAPTPTALRSLPHLIGAPWSTGHVAFETFPAWVGLACFPHAGARGPEVPRTNPRAATFRDACWARAVAFARGALAQAGVEVGDILDGLRSERPTKALQDQLDALLCLVVALWVVDRPASLCALGALGDGLAVGPRSAALDPWLVRAAQVAGVSSRDGLGCPLNAIGDRAEGR